MSTRRRALGPAVAAASVLLSLLGAEAATRAIGMRPWEPRTPGLLVEPGGALYRTHPTLGYALRPGRFSVLFESGLRFRCEHDAQGHRVTASDAASEPARPEVWIFGGSFTYGWAIDDAESFPWRVQQRMPELRVRNFGVPGYGTLHAWIELEERLEEAAPPAFVVVAYASFHELRNVLARERRKRVAPFAALGLRRQPFARLGTAGGLDVAMAEIAYEPWPGMRRSALVHLAETRWNQLERRRLHESDVTRALLERIATRARSAGSRVILAPLTRNDPSNEVVAWARQSGVEVQDLAIDLERPGYRNRPHDEHPSARATAEYAALLERALRRSAPASD